MFEFVPAFFDRLRLSIFEYAFPEYLEDERRYLEYLKIKKFIDNAENN
jgi:hypothetical protein